MPFPDRNISVKIKFSPIGNAPRLKEPVATFSGEDTMGKIAEHLKKVTEHDSVFIYVNNCFEPLCSWYVADLAKVFGRLDGEQLAISYSVGCRAYL